MESHIALRMCVRGYQGSPPTLARVCGNGHPSYNQSEFFDRFSQHVSGLAAFPRVWEARFPAVWFGDDMVPRDTIPWPE
ncbi:MAG: hypothetical protein ACLP9L_41280 [Thermoguttaceae bacterium]